MGSRGVKMSFRETFQNKATRDARYKELTAQGLKLKKTSFGPCELHPMYIKDWGFEYCYGELSLSDWIKDLGIPFIQRTLKKSTGLKWRSNNMKIQINEVWNSEGKSEVLAIVDAGINPTAAVYEWILKNRPGLPLANTISAHGFHARAV